MISVYALCTDINNIVTPDLKMPGQGVLCYVRCDDVRTLGGTAFSQVINQRMIFTKSKQHATFH